MTRPAPGPAATAEIRPATPADAAACAAIYAPYVTDSIISFEADPPTPTEMRRRIRSAHLWLVAEEAGEVCGYAYGSPHREREAYQWAADVAIYLSGAHHRRGLGRRLYEQLLDGLRDRGLCMACAGIGLPNPASEGFHRALGFVEVGVYRRIGFKFGRWVDTRWYQLELRGGDPPARLRTAAAGRGADLPAELERILRYSPDRRVAVARAADAIRHHTGWPWVGIYSVHDGEVVNQAWSGQEPPAHPRFAVGEGLTSAALSTRATVYCRDVAADERYLTNQATTGSELIVPIVIDEAVSGTLDIESDCADAFSERDRELAEDTARRLAPLWRLP